MTRPKVTLNASGPNPRNVELRVGDNLVSWTAIDIRIRPDEIIEMTVVLQPDEISFDGLDQARVSVERSEL
nr:hypothetical protein [Dietzia maris]